MLFLVRFMHKISPCKYSFKIPPFSHTCLRLLTLFVYSLMRILIGIIHLVVRKIFPKTNISYPLIRKLNCEYLGVRDVSLSENFEYVLNE